MCMDVYDVHEGTMGRGTGCMTLQLDVAKAVSQMRIVRVGGRGTRGGSGPMGLRRGWQMVL